MDVTAWRDSTIFMPLLPYCRTLVIPDVHLRWRLVDALLKEVEHDDVVYLGDFFDQFRDSAKQNRQQAIWLKAELKKPARTFLWGNHDLHYATPNHHTTCSGYESGKDIAINEIMQPEDWAKFQWYCWRDSWLLTHAGLHPSFVPAEVKDLIIRDPKLKHMALDNWLSEECGYADAALRKNESHRFFRAGRARYGNQQYGGLTWLDFNREFAVVPGINQLVGHTNQIATWSPGTIETDDSANHCIDCDSKYYAVCTNGKLSLKEIPEQLMGLRNRLD